MTDRQIQRKLNQLVKIANELSDEAHRRYQNGSLFFESEGTFFILDGDEDGGATGRQKHIKLNSEGYCRMGCGSW